MKTYDSAQSFDLMGLIRYVQNINDESSSISYLSVTFLVENNIGMEIQTTVSLAKIKERKQYS